MRLEIKEGIQNSMIINDTYSLDINSLRIALDFLVSQSDRRKKTVIISDFEQVFPLETTHYQELNKLLKEKKVGRLLAVGNQISLHQDTFDFDEQYFFSTTEELLKKVLSLNFDHEAILIKGARNYQFEKITELLQYKTHKTILQVNLPAIVHNLSYYRSFLKPDTKVMAMVKALCYGLGDAEIINELIYNHIDYLAVAYTDEGVRLRQRNITTPIVVLGAEAHSFETMINYGLEPEIFNFYYLEELIKTLTFHPEIQEFNIHIKLDTGMHRLGFTAADLTPLATRIQEIPQLKIISIFSHLAAAEDAQEDTFTRQQIAQFKEMSDTFSARFPYPIMRHILNSAGISRFSEIAQFEMVRLGIGLYGCSSVPNEQAQLQDPVTLKSVVTEVKKIAKGESVGYNRTFVADRDTTLAIIPIGYADGLPRELSNGVGNILIHNKLAPIIGKICMDVCMVDVTDFGVKEGDEVIVYGAGNPLYSIANTLHKIPYELLTAISRRVPREYIVS
jgi:alanine racemase